MWPSAFLRTWPSVAPRCAGRRPIGREKHVIFSRALWVGKRPVCTRTRWKAFQAHWWRKARDLFWLAASAFLIQLSRFIGGEKGLFGGFTSLEGWRVRIFSYKMTFRIKPLCLDDLQSTKVYYYTVRRFYAVESPSTKWFHNIFTGYLDWLISGCKENQFLMRSW